MQGQAGMLAASCTASSQKSAELHVSFGSDQQFSSAPVAKPTRGWFLEESPPAFCRRGDGRGDTGWCAATLGARAPARAAYCYSAGALRLLLFILQLH